MLHGPTNCDDNRTNRISVADQAPPVENPLVDNINLDMGLGWASNDSFVFSDSALPYQGGNVHEGLPFPGVNLPGLNGADLSSLLFLDSYWPQ